MTSFTHQRPAGRVTTRSMSRPKPEPEPETKKEPKRRQKKEPNLEDLPDSTSVGPVFASEGQQHMHVFEARSIVRELPKHYVVSWEDSVLTRREAKIWLRAAKGRVVKLIGGKTGRLAKISWQDTHILKKNASRALIEEWEAEKDGEGETDSDVGKENKVEEAEEDS